MDALMAHDFMIPKHKRLTGTARAEEEFRRAVHEFLKVIGKDRLQLLAIVTGGRAHWKKVAGQAFRGFMSHNLTAKDTAINGLFDIMVEAAGPDPTKQYEELQRSELVALKMEKLQGLVRFIEDERHLDEVLDKWVPDGDERAALRSQLLIMMKTQGVSH